MVAKHSYVLKDEKSSKSFGGKNLSNKVCLHKKRHLFGGTFLYGMMFYHAQEVIEACP